MMFDNALLLSSKDTPFVPDKFLVWSTLLVVYMLSRIAAKKGRG